MDRVLMVDELVESVNEVDGMNADQIVWWLVFLSNEELEVEVIRYRNYMQSIKKGIEYR